MERIAIIDFGSNTAKLIALAFEPGHSWRQLDELRAVVRLSEGLEAGGALQQRPFERGVAALSTFASYARAAGIMRVVATATSAVRDASNGRAFVAAAKKLGIELRVLSGEDEARIAALAVINGLDLQQGITLDLGGGSMQLSRIEKRRWQAGRSWPLGAVRASERFLEGDPPKAKGVKALRAAARAAAEEAVAAWWGKAKAVRAEDPTLVAMGGTMRNVANVHQKQSGYPLDLLHGYTLPAQDLFELSETLLGMSTAQRAQLAGLNRDRSDIIAAGAAVIAEVVRTLGVPEVRVSGQGLREGNFYPFLLPDEPEHLIPDVRTFSVLNLMRQYHDEPQHNGHVRMLALALFDALRDRHPWGEVERELLGHAAWIHDIGMAVDYYRHEHHGLALTLGRALAGFTHREQALLALLVRFHRKGQPGWGVYAPLMHPGDDARLLFLAAVLRLAEYLERGKAQRVREVAVRSERGALLLLAHGHGDISLEVDAAAARSDLLAQVLGRDVRVLDGAVLA